MTSLEEVFIRLEERKFGSRREYVTSKLKSQSKMKPRISNLISMNETNGETKFLSSRFAAYFYIKVLLSANTKSVGIHTIV